MDAENGSGGTALTRATGMGHIEVVRVLLEAGEQK